MALDSVDIVLVEDNPDDASLTIRALRKNGINNSLIHLKDGEEAIDFIFCRGHYSQRVFGILPRLIVLDLKMPKVDGIEVLKQVKSDARTCRIPVVLLTSSNQEQDILKSYQLGVNSYIVKPVEFELFVKTVAGMGLYWLMMNQLPY
ncbi:response regulator [Flavitalea sp. BT771]|uniref:response regulator n=1 Tax=Flavitalea sp. BT771 TaxID=3063329 RepID=UPI0026E2F25E|nr:response regulator [Flavitalea sp. BT771]MDO6432731.1 response regulator [Flavitalea sp. BT771]MDV6221993.1 response regulator [Flavitalea sp. BT771]